MVKVAARASPSLARREAPWQTEGVRGRADGSGSRPGLSRGSLPASLDALAACALDDDEAAAALAEALAALDPAERVELLDGLRASFDDEFPRLLGRLVGASGSPMEALALVNAERTAARAFRDGERLFLVRGASALEVARGRVAVHDAMPLDGLEAQPLESTIDEAARLLWRHHRGALPQEARRFAGFFDPAPRALVPRASWPS